METPPDPRLPGLAPSPMATWFHLLCLSELPTLASSRLPIALPHSCYFFFLFNSIPTPTHLSSQVIRTVLTILLLVNTVYDLEEVTIA